jgi:hypothetical protein
MVGSQFFHTINQPLGEIFGLNVPFVGISVIAFGNFRQLRPVGDKYIFHSNLENVLSTLVENGLWNRFKYFEKVKIIRQNDDAFFAIALKICYLVPWNLKILNLTKVVRY